MRIVCELDSIQGVLRILYLLGAKGSALTLLLLLKEEWVALLGLDEV
jgi:hypothetical protein